MSVKLIVVTIITQISQLLITDGGPRPQDDVQSR